MPRTRIQINNCTAKRLIFILLFIFYKAKVKNEIYKLNIVGKQIAFFDVEDIATADLTLSKRRSMV